MGWIAHLGAMPREDEEDAIAFVHVLHEPVESLHHALFRGQHVVRVVCLHRLTARIFVDHCNDIPATEGAVLCEHLDPVESVIHRPMKLCWGARVVYANDHSLPEAWHDAKRGAACDAHRYRRWPWALPKP